MTGTLSSASRPVIIGAGLAGLTTALSLAPMHVTVLCAGKLGEQCSSVWAQGGIAAAVGLDDNAALHAEDTLKAGAGFSDPAITKLVTEGGAKVIEKLTAQGVVFDRDAAGQMQLGLEAAHSRRRIVHVGGDGAGQAVMQAVIQTARAIPSITIIENAQVTDLLTEDNAITGVAFEHDGNRQILATDRVVLATGGAGALWRHTTNPSGSWGSGLALAARAGAELIDLEFMQFHPTAIDIGRDPMPLASEALRGEGAILSDETGARFMAGFPRAELEPRDVVACAIHAHMNKGHRVFLDARSAIGDKFAARFPSIHAACISAGIDPATSPIPIRPAAHYHMGGVKVDDHGQSSVTGLYACGEAASTGLHGANRLASNSLLEAAFFGARVAEEISSQRARSNPLPLAGRVREGGAAPIPKLPNESDREKIRTIMSAHLGVLRDETGIETAIETLTPLAAQSDMALAGLMIATAALRHEESRGSHRRSDYPEISAKASRQTLTLHDVLNDATPAPAHSPRVAAGV